MNKLLTSLSAASVLICATGAAQATPVIYSPVGTQNATEYTFTAQSTGELIAYFVGSTADYTNVITLLVNGVASSIQGLNNHASSYGDALSFGTVQAGDSLVFELITIAGATGVGPWYSEKSLNSDGVNHVYSYAYGGDSIVGAGTYVAFEDKQNGGNLNYNDESFVFTNVSSATNVPEPGSLALLGLGLVGFAASRRKGNKTL